MSAKRNQGLVEPYISPARGGYSDSQSPQARRGSAQDFSRFGDRTVHDGITWKEDPSVGEAFDNASPLSIEKTNPAK
jgi:hypothetical protein